MARLKSSLVDDTANEIMTRIKEHRYSAGEIISEVALSQELDISRTPVREAILRLLDYGVLERTATKVVVKPLTLNDIIEILEVREAIETMSVKIIMRKGGLSKQQLKELDKLCQKFKNSNIGGDYNEKFILDNAFHETLISYSGNSRLIDISKRINIQSQRSRWITTITPTRHYEAANEHQAILDALTQKSENDAKIALASHFASSLANYQSILMDDKWLNMMKELKGII